ncbi:MAG: polysaccharide biosynthesis/export family protein [Acidobacteriaceae bacterium]
MKFCNLTIGAVLLSGVLCAQQPAGTPPTTAAVSPEKAAQPAPPQPAPPLKNDAVAPADANKSKDTGKATDAKDTVKDTKDAKDPKDKAPEAAPVVPAATDANSETYIIGPQDMVSVSVWKEPDLSGSLPVRPDGMISMPLLHDVEAAGFTPMQLSTDIATRLKKFVNDPQVSVVVTSINSQRVFILGEVGHQGPLPLNAGMTALQAIATAGGLSPFANQKKIYILRAENGTKQKIPFNYKKALKGDEKQNIALKSNDTIVVP